jgi:hypothetical protein
MNRRQFLLNSGLAASLGTAALPAAENGSVSIVLPDSGPLGGAEPIRWAANELREALAAKGVSARIVPQLEQAPTDGLCIVVASDTARPAETVVLSARNEQGRSLIQASGAGTRGIVYALTELADRVRFAADPLAALAIPSPVVETPANRIRSIARCFVSDLEDKSWYHDRAMWNEYLSMLVTQRLNRFSMTFGLQYNYPMPVTDSYLYFTYPFLLSVPGYDVRAQGLPDSERDRNLETLKFIGEQTVRRGLQFQIGLWTHGYVPPPSSKPNYLIEGLSAENHAAYCRDALNMLLEAVPSISGITFRIHGESGIAEGAYDFWKVVFQGILKTGRTIEIDMHAKGMDFKMVDVALATGMPVKLSPKYWAEHMGLGYHQAAIRELEMPPRDAQSGGLFTFSNGSRKFLRYGYGDLYREDRRYGILYRIWPGTQRVLLWGDPAMAAAYGRSAHLCGSDGVEWCEPLSFKGRMGSGVPGGRCSYADASLNPKYDWQKFEYTYRVWGRLTYDPEANPEGWRRYLSDRFAAAGPSVEAAVANASRVLPLITSAHDPSASNNTYWPEIYTNQPILDAGRANPYKDTPAPRVFGNVSSLDPQLFSRISDHAAELLNGQLSGKYSPIEVAQWLDDAALAAAKHWTEAEKRAGAAKSTPEFRRAAADVAIQSGLGRFFAWKLRAGLLWEIYDRTGDSSAGAEALKAYRKARDSWAELAAVAKLVYVEDVSYGPQPHLRGHWMDRLPAIETDLADMEQRVRSGQHAPAAQGAVHAALSRPKRPSITIRHTPPASFHPGETLPIEAAFGHGDGRQVRLHYRHVDQAELWTSTLMERQDNVHRGTIPGNYTKSVYALQYYFEVREPSGEIGLHPGFEPNLANQPYFVVRT